MGDEIANRLIVIAARVFTESSFMICRHRVKTDLTTRSPNHIRDKHAGGVFAKKSAASQTVLISSAIGND
jgi:hypothetical protein